jgi:hypothetical protein
METKPFSIQSPEQIAKDYGGNKQRIAQAMQMGLLDPTAGTLAGMFIDRMRGAAQQEGAPQQTVAQQVFAPPQMTSPPMGQPQMQMPQGLGQPQIPMPQETPPMGMAGGGLTALPLPESMFDEPADYAGGGIVAFAQGGEAEEDELGGFYKDPVREREKLRQLYQPKTEARDRARGLFEGMLDPEQQKKRLSEDKWMALGQIGAKMAQTPGSLFQALGAGIEAALPGIQEASKERRAEVRDAVMQMAQMEGLDNKEAMELAREALSGTKTFAELQQKAKEMAQQSELAKMEDKTRRYVADTGAAAQMGSARITANSFEAQAKRQEAALDKQARNEAMKAAAADMAKVNFGMAPKDPAAKAAYDQEFLKRFNFYYQSYLGASPSGAPASTGVGGYGSPPPGAVKRVG